MATVVAKRNRQPFAGRYPLWSRVLAPLIIYAVLIILAIIFLFPLYLVVRNGLMLQKEITSNDWMWFSPSPHFETLNDLFNNPEVPFAHGLFNSAITSTVQLIGQLLFASMAGYGLARIPFRGRNLVFFLILFALMIPSAVTFIPTYIIVATMGMVN